MGSRYTQTNRARLLSASELLGAAAHDYERRARVRRTETCSEASQSSFCVVDVLFTTIGAAANVVRYADRVGVAGRYEGLERETTEK